MENEEFLKNSSEKNEIDWLSFIRKLKKFKKKLRKLNKELSQFYDTME